MNVKKALLMVAFTGLCCTSVFAQFTFSSVHFNNEKLNISEYLYEEDVWGNRSWITKGLVVFIKNKTNNEMEVKVNYTVFLSGYDRSKKMITREKRITGRTIKLQPNENVMLAAKFDRMEHSDLSSAFPDIGAIDFASITNFELVNFKVKEKNYEVPW
jgi:hypothetical protein